MVTLTSIRSDMTDRWSSLKAYAPGLMLAATLALAAMFVSQHYGAPVMLMALLFGMAFNFLSEDGQCKAGVQFTSTRLLKIAVALLGFRVSLADLLSIGVGPLIAIPMFVVATIGAGVVLSKLLGRDTVFGMLTGGAVAICGASAALALSAVLPATKDHEKNTLFTVIAVTTLSTIAMVVYPVLFGALGFTDAQSGILIGATIHDVAQVVGAGYAISDEAGNVATFVKMLRVAMLPLAVLAFAVLSRRAQGTAGAKAPVPWFAIGFAALLLVNSSGFVPDVVVAAINDTSRWLLIAAIAALGVKTSIKSMASLGGAHISLVVLETVFLLVVAMATVRVFIAA